MVSAEMMEEAGETEFSLWWESRVGTYGDWAEYNDPNRPHDATLDSNRTLYRCGTLYICPQPLLLQSRSGM